MCNIYIYISINILQNLRDFFKAHNLGFQIIISNTLCFNRMGCLLPIVRSRREKLVSYTLPIPVSKLFLLKESFLVPYL